MDVATLTKDTILDKAVFEEIESISDTWEQSQLLAKIQLKAKELKVLGAFNQLRTAYRKSTLQVFDRGRFTDFGAEVPRMACGDWVADESGVRRYDNFGLEVKACSHPILIARTFFNEQTSMANVEIKFKLQEAWKAVTVERGVIASANRIVGLSNYGIRVTSETARNLVSFLDELEQQNVEYIPTLTSTSKLGWTKDGGFMPYNTEIHYDGAERNKTLYNAVNEVGSYNVWLEGIKRVRAKNNMVLNLYLISSFASVLTSRLGVLPFIVNLCSETGSGKTVALMCAMSAWGDPRALVQSSDSTITSLELKLDALNHLPLALDDLSVLAKRTQGDYSSIVYQLCEGEGRGRANKDCSMRQTATWRNIIMTNCERSIIQSGMQGGAVNRVIEIQSEERLFPGTEGNEMVSMITQNYGHAGRMWIEYLCSGGYEEVYNRFQENLKAFTSEMERLHIIKSDKQYIPMALLLAVDEAIEKLFFNDSVYLDFDKCFTMCKDLNAVSECEQAYSELSDWIQMNAVHFDDKFNVMSYGDIDGKTGYVRFIPRAFDMACAELGVGAAEFKQWLLKHGHLDTNSNASGTGHGSHFTKSIRIGGRTERRIIVELKEDNNGFEDAPAKEDLPFT